jgi:Ser/Thr protein kinase RdoA (MazF antagonist)
MARQNSPFVYVNRSDLLDRNDWNDEIILDALRRHGFVTDDPGWRIEPAPGGSTGRTFRILNPAGAHELVVRLARPGLEAWLQHEEQVLRELATLPGACSPRDITHIDDPALPEGQMLVHTHLRGEPRSLLDVSVEARERLGECLERVHRQVREGFMIWPALEVRQGTRADAWRARLASLGQFRAASGPVPGIEERIDRLRAIDLHPSAGWQERIFSTIHGDLSAGNILWEGEQPTLIDWEFAREGDSAEDLAYLVAEQRLGPDLVADIAEGYVGAGGEAWAFARLPAWLPLVTLDAALWWADYWLAQEADPTQAREVMDRLTQIDHYLP